MSSRTVGSRNEDHVVNNLKSISKRDSRLNRERRSRIKRRVNRQILRNAVR